MEKAMNFITVCTDKYPIAYAEIITKRFKGLTRLPFNYFCITDRPDNVKTWADPITPEIKTQGWWNKINLFGTKVPPGHTLYMDLDIVIRANFDNEIVWGFENIDSIGCISDAIAWHGERFSSSMMWLNCGAYSQIFQEFKDKTDQIIDTPGGDQIWLGPKLNNVLYVDEQFPKLKHNLKFHIGRIEEGNLFLPKMIEDDVKLIDCGGEPKPHHLKEIPYISENWHKVLTEIENDKKVMQASLRAKMSEIQREI